MKHVIEEKEVEQKRLLPLSFSRYIWRTVSKTGPINTLH